MHWHGMHLPAGDGRRAAPAASRRGQTWSPTWKIDQPAATLWYHPHPHGETAQHVYRGLAGMFILDDAATTLALPSTYGVDDIPVIVQDKQFDDDGGSTRTARRSGRRRHPRRHDRGQRHHRPYLDGHHLAGAAAAAQRVQRPPLRLRLRRRPRLRSWSAPTAACSRRPSPPTRIQLSPGERAEIVVGGAGGRDGRAAQRPAGSGHRRARRPLRRRRTIGSTSCSCAPRRTLAPSAAGAREAGRDRPAGPETGGAVTPVPAAGQDDQRRARWTWAGSTRPSSRAAPRSGRSPTTTAPRTASTSTTCSSRCSSRRERPAAAAARLEGHRLPARRTTRCTLIARFADYSDPNTPYMFHCHVLLHEDEGMMGQFVVVEPGQQGGPIHTH